VGIRNSVFVAKKPAYHLSEILITKHIAELDQWNLAAIDARQEQMSNAVNGIWAFPPNADEAVAG
jgi:hypothetical protein